MCWGICRNCHEGGLRQSLLGAVQERTSLVETKILSSWRAALSGRTEFSGLRLPPNGAVHEIDNIAPHDRCEKRRFAFSRSRKKIPHGADSTVCNYDDLTKTTAAMAVWYLPVSTSPQEILGHEEVRLFSFVTSTNEYRLHRKKQKKKKQQVNTRADPDNTLGILQKLLPTAAKDWRAWYNKSTTAL